MRARRYLPSVSLLAAFEAVLRSGSTAAAARDLNLSQGAVSRLIQALEQQLGRPLFERQRRRLIPTEAALVYGRDVTRALDLVERASLAFIANPAGGLLSLAILPAFGSNWLAPRLGAFQRRHPGITINLATRMKRFNFDTDTFDAAIHFGKPDWRDADHLRIFDERLTACAAPSFLRDNPIARPEDLLSLPLLRLETRPTGWRRWFEGNGTTELPARGMMFDQFAPMTQAAIAGLGVALLPDYLADIEIAEGRLAPVLRRSIPGSGAYWLVWPTSRAAFPPLQAFRAWLAEEIGDAAPTHPTNP